MVRMRRQSATVRAAVGLGACACMWLLSAVCLAEVVVLRDGRRIAGKCRLSGREVSVARGLTTLYVPRASIERVELHPAEQAEFEKMRRQLERAGALGRYKLARWLDDHLQYERADVYYAEAIELDPNHSRARRALGYRRAGRGWVSDPAKQLARAARGFGTSAAEACVKLGKTYAENKQDRSAELAFRRALAADPYHQEALKLIQPFLAGYKPKNSYRTPLMGKTIAITHHDHKQVAYMYHAMDLAKVDAAGALHSGDPAKLESYHTWDVPVHAAAAGKVISVEQRFVDVPIGRPGDFLQANSVCIEHPGGEYTLYAHLRQASVVVRKGRHVKAGELLGKVGNSGTSSSPHLHFCLYDGDGISLPVTFVEEKPDAGK